MMEDGDLGAISSLATEMRAAKLSHEVCPGARRVFFFFLILEVLGLE